MSHDTTLDTEGVDLSPVAREVVTTHRAAPAAVVGAAARGQSAPVSSPVVTSASQALGGSLPGPVAVALGWRFGWGAYGKLWSEPPSESTASSSPPVGHSASPRVGPAAAPPTVTSHAIFDLASLTKPITALLFARLQRAGVVNRSEPLCALLPQTEGTPSARVSLDLLMAHRAGLQDHVELFVKQAGAQQPTRERILFGAASARRPDCSGDPPADGFPEVYSDLGYLLVGEALAARANKPLDDLIAEHVARPLGLTLGSMRYLERHEPMARARTVPTERVDWRGGVLRGVVHDENAWALAGQGCAGHAGLFADVWSVVRLGTAILDAASGRKSKWLGKGDLEPLLRRRPGGSHTAGFDTRRTDDGTPMSGSRFGASTFGHLGFTGTSIWCDPDRDLVGVLLTNRVHPTRTHEAIKQARPAAYDAIWAAMH